MLDQLFQAGRLAIVVAKDMALGTLRGSTRQEGSQAAGVTLDGGRPARLEDGVADVFFHEDELRMPAGALRQPSRSQEEVARACGRAAPAESVAVPFPGLVPDLPGVLFPGIAALPNQDRVAAQPVKHGAGRAPRHLDAAPRS